MNLHALTQTVRRHKLATIPVLLLAIAGIGYVVAVKSPTFEAKSSYILVPGAPAPTTTQTAQNPALKNENTYNPLANDGGLSIVADALSEAMSSASAAAVVAHDGGGLGSYTVAPDTIYYGTPPIVDITADGPTAAAATSTAEAVGRAMQKQLATMQAAQGTSPRYWIALLELAQPDNPTMQLSSKLRDLVAVIAAAVVLLFVIVSILNAREERKREALQPEPLPLPTEPVPLRPEPVHESNGWHTANEGQPVSPYVRAQLKRTTERRWHDGLDTSRQREQQQSAPRLPE
jgi:hypothetical protein